MSASDAQDALLRLKPSAATEIPGKKLKLTGPVILRSLPVAVFTEEESNLVSRTGSTVEAAYHTPIAIRMITPPRALMVILTNLLILY
jgi:hypothetical protein